MKIHFFDWIVEIGGYHNNFHIMFLWHKYHIVNSYFTWTWLIMIIISPSSIICAETSPTKNALNPDWTRRIRKALPMYPLLLLRKRFLPSLDLLINFMHKLSESSSNSSFEVHFSSSLISSHIFLIFMVTPPIF